MSSDLQRLSEDNIIGLSFMVDTNKDREITFDKDFTKLDDKETFGIIILYIKRNIFKI